MKLNSDKFFKDFNNQYLLFIEDDTKSISCIKRNIKNQIEKYLKMCNLKRLCTRNEEYWLIRGWSLEDSIIKIKNIKENWKKPKYSNLNIKFWLDRGFTELESIKKISEIQKNRSQKATNTRMNNLNYIPLISPFTEDFWIKKGITDKNEIEYKIKSQRKLNIEYWLNKGFNKHDSIKKVSEYQKENSMKSIKNWQSKKGTIEYKNRQSTNIEYYLNKGFSILDGERLLIERQRTFTLEKCIIKYGLEEGSKIYNKRQKDWIKKMFNENTCMSTGRSLISDKFIENLIISINNIDITDNFLYGKNEKFIYDNLEKKASRYDLCYKNKIIEFNGDFWHSNPKIFEANDIHKIKKIKCSEIWAKDNRKIESAKEHNYEVLIIWESEYINNKNEIIKKCENFLEI